MSVDDEDEYDGSEADGMEPDGDGADPFVPMLEDDGHRLGRPARRGVGVVGFVPAPTRLSIPELDWLMRVRDGAGRSVRVPGTPVFAFRPRRGRIGSRTPVFDGVEAGQPDEEPVQGAAA
ncbi:hypothetical protein PL893_10155 [Bifidobacterium adolescentis]|nr:hypothetical protein [Bifidobacterium adolescentis]